MALTRIGITKELRSFGPADLLAIVLLVALLAGLLAVAHTWARPFQAAVNIDLSGSALAGYALLSLARNFAAFGVSLVLALWWGLWAAKSRLAERILIPVVDVLQSIPVLGFMPGLVLALMHVFPSNRVGLELACILMIVTSQAWNMILCVYQGVKSIPLAMNDAASNAGLNRRQRFLLLELPCVMTPLAWNSLLSVGNGWFFVTVNEAFALGDRDFRLPGVGSYMSVAMDRGDVKAMALGMMTMAIMVLALDQLLWRPLVLWADRFRTDEQAPQDPNSSLVLRVMGRSRVVQALGGWGMGRLRDWARSGVHETLQNLALPYWSRPSLSKRWSARLKGLVGVLIIGLLLLGAWRLVAYFALLGAGQWLMVLGNAGLTLGRILLATLLCAVWAVPLGVRIGLDPRLTKYFQPFIQMVNAYPAPMLFPALLVVFFAMGLNFEVAVVLLLVIGNFAYLLFNVIGGASQIPLEQRQAWRAYGVRGWPYWRRFILPAILPSLVVGLNTTIGAAWNATIVTEYIRLNGQGYAVPHGLGATIDRATESGDLALLTAAVFVMSALVVAINRLVWQPLSDYAARISS